MRTHPADLLVLFHLPTIKQAAARMWPVCLLLAYSVHLNYWFILARKHKIQPLVQSDQFLMLFEQHRKQEGFHRQDMGGGATGVAAAAGARCWRAELKSSSRASWSLRRRARRNFEKDASSCIKVWVIEGTVRPMANSPVVVYLPLLSSRGGARISVGMD
jgi:hypothetical protein